MTYTVLIHVPLVHVAACGSEWPFHIQILCSLSHMHLQTDVPLSTRAYQLETVHNMFYKVYAQLRDAWTLVKFCGLYVQNGDRL